MSEFAYFEVDGNVVHGLVDVIQGRRISKEEAVALSSLKRQNQPAEVSPHAERIEQLEADVRNLLSLLAKGGT